MNLFETVKTAISVRQAAKRYGLTVGKNGMCRCPFHADKTPSMKLNEAYYYCFGCKAHGDAIALTAQLLHLPPGSAAAELAQAFHVDISACQGRGKERRRQHYQLDTLPWPISWPPSAKRAPPGSGMHGSGMHRRC